MQTTTHTIHTTAFERRCRWLNDHCQRHLACKKGSPYSITECRVPELILVLDSQPAGDMSHKPTGRLPLLSA